MREIHYWSAEERTFIIENYLKLGRAKCAEALNRNPEAVRSVWKNRVKAHRPSHRAWTEEELEILKRDYSSTGPRVLARILNRSVKSIERKADHFHLHMDPEKMRLGRLLRKSNAITRRFNQKGIIDRRAWSRAVIYRDDFTCSRCGLRDPSIVVAHHVVPETESALLARDPSNGITLCPNCHAKQHIEMGRQSSGRRLTKKDKETIIDLHTLGYSTNRIAIDLGINDKTVDKYLREGKPPSD